MFRAAGQSAVHMPAERRRRDATIMQHFKAHAPCRNPLAIAGERLARLHYKDDSGQGLGIEGLGFLFEFISKGPVYCDLPGEGIRRAGCR